MFVFMYLQCSFVTCCHNINAGWNLSLFHVFLFKKKINKPWFLITLLDQPNKKQYLLLKSPQSNSLKAVDSYDVFQRCDSRDLRRTSGKGKNVYLTIQKVHQPSCSEFFSDVWEYLCKALCSQEVFFPVSRRLQHRSGVGGHFQSTSTDEGPGLIFLGKSVT